MGSATIIGSLRKSRLICFVYCLPRCHSVAAYYWRCLFGCVSRCETCTMQICSTKLSQGFLCLCPAVAYPVLSVPGSGYLSWSSVGDLAMSELTMALWV